MPPKKTVKKSETDNSHKPWVSNYPPLAEWLERHEARCMWQTPRESKPFDAGYDWSPQAYIECWMIAGKRPFIILVYGDRMGWEIYTDGDTPKIDDTLADAERRLGLKLSTYE